MRDTIQAQVNINNYNIEWQFIGYKGGGIDERNRGSLVGCAPSPCLYMRVHAIGCTERERTPTGSQHNTASARETSHITAARGKEGQVMLVFFI